MKLLNTENTIESRADVSEIEAEVEDEVVKVTTYSASEEVANALTHGLGVAAAIVALTLMIVKAQSSLSPLQLLGVCVYGGSLILMFLSSTLYHAISHSSSKKLLKTVDHCAIYLLIAGTYTPLMMISLDTTMAQVLLVIIWSLAIAGLVFKAFFTGRFKKLSIITYVAMGWLSMLVVQQLYQVLPINGFILLLAGGLAYTLGVPFYMLKSRRYNHAIWHVFVFAGAACHCILVAVYVIPVV